MAKLKYPLAILGIFIVALFLRTYFPYHNVFNGEWINFQETDCYFNMRVITNLAQHFPHMLSFDPYGFYPSGIPVYNPPFFYYLFAFIAWVIGLGHPSVHLIELVGAWLPAILGALITIPVFVIGKELFNKRVGLLAAALIAVFPGQFLWRGMLGFPDYHVLEVLLTTVSLMFMILALRRTGKIAWMYASLAGLFFTFYVLTWAGSGLFIFILFAFITAQSILNHIKNKPNAQLAIVGILTFGISFIGAILFLNEGLNSLMTRGLLVALIGCMAIWLYDKYGSRLPKIIYPLIPILSGFAAIGFISIFYPSFLSSIIDQLGIIAQSGGMQTIAEVRGLSLQLAWYQFAICFYVALLSLPFLTYYAIKETSSEKTLLVVWSVIIFAATFGQNRFSYYLAIPVALLSAFLLWKVAGYVISLAPENKKIARPELRRKKKKSKKDKRKQKARHSLSPRLIYATVIGIVVLLVAFLPNTLIAIDRVEANTGMSSDWHNALVWLGNNTAEPLPHMPYYGLQLNQKQYKPNSYGVISWWDYGYWISYISHRIPNANPSQMGAKDAGLFFTSGNETEAAIILKNLGSKYIVIDQDMATGKHYAMIAWAERTRSDYLDIYYSKDEQGQLRPVMLYHLGYYQSMCSRLYNFGGEAVATTGSMYAIAWQEQVIDNDVLKVINDAKQFTTYEEAQAFIATKSGYRIVSDNPFSSPIPLEKLEHYKMVYSNSTIKVFEYTPEGD